MQKGKPKVLAKVSRKLPFPAVTGCKYAPTVEKKRHPKPERVEITQQHEINRLRNQKTREACMNKHNLKMNIKKGARVVATRVRRTSKELEIQGGNSAL